MTTSLRNWPDPIKSECSFHLLKHTGTYWNILETYWNILEHIETYWNILEHIGTYWNILEHIGTYWNILEHIGNILEHIETCWKHFGTYHLFVLCFLCITWLQAFWAYTFFGENTCLTKMTTSVITWPDPTTSECSFHLHPQTLIRNYPFWASQILYFFVAREGLT